MRFLLITAALIGLAVQALAASGAARTSLQKFSAQVRTLSGQFEQKVLDANNRVIDQSSGEVKLMAPRQFRWQVKQPEPQLVVADGDNIWVYDPELEQVSVRAQSFDEANSPLAVLLDLAMLDQEFTVKEAGRKEGLEWLSLTSKAKEPDFKLAELGFDANGLARMRLTDTFNQRTEIRFTKWQRNPKLPSKDFQFTPPAGVDVVGTPAEKPQVVPIRD